MKRLLLLFSIICFTNDLFSQYGHFRNPSQELVLHEDSTFLFFAIINDHERDFVDGKWLMKNDTVYFYPKILSDTLIVHYNFYCQNRLEHFFRKKRSNSKYLINIGFIYYARFHVRKPYTINLYKNNHIFKFKDRKFSTNKKPDSISVELGEKRVVIEFDKEKLDLIKSKHNYLFNQYGLAISIRYHTFDFMHYYFPNNKAVIIEHNNCKLIQNIPSEEERRIFQIKEY